VSHCPQKFQNQKHPIKKIENAQKSATYGVFFNSLARPVGELCRKLPESHLNGFPYNMETLINKFNKKYMLHLFLQLI